MFWGKGEGMGEYVSRVINESAACVWFVYMGHTPGITCPLLISFSMMGRV